MFVHRRDVQIGHRQRPHLSRRRRGHLAHRRHARRHAHRGALVHAARRQPRGVRGVEEETTVEGTEEKKRSTDALEAYFSAVEENK